MFKGQKGIRKKEFPQLLNRVWLNSAAFVPLPVSTVKAMELIIRYFHKPEMSEKSEKFFESLPEETYIQAAKLLKCNPKDISLVVNTAHGLNFPLHGIEWEKGDNIVTCDLEFPTNFMPWKYISKKKNLELRIAKVYENNQLKEEDIINLIDDKTKLVALSYVQFNNGQKIDAEKIAKTAHKYNALVALDAIQACGGVEVYPSLMGVDFLSAGGPKFLMAPLGIGLCYINPKIVETMEPPFQGGANYDFSDHNYMNREAKYYDGAKRFQNGTLPLYCIAGLNESLKIINSVGISTIAKHNLDLIQMLIDEFADMNLTVITPVEKERRGALVNVRLGENKDLEKIVKNLEINYKVTISARFGGLRFSTQLFNTEKDIHKAITALKKTLSEN